MADLGTVSKAEALSVLSKTTFGFYPTIQYTDRQAIIRFTPDQNKVIQNYFNRMMDPNNPGDIDIDLVPIVGPWTIKAALPWFIGAIGLGLVSGVLISRK